MSSKPKKQRPSANELALAELSGKKDQRFEEAFRPLEQAAISELTTADAGKRSALLAGRQNADLEAAAAQSAGQGMMADIQSNTFGGGATTERGFRRAGGVESGRTAIKTSADQTARDSIDQDTLNVIKTGQGVARQSQSSLTAAAGNSNSRARSRLAAAELKDTARMQALGHLAGAGISAGLAAKDSALDRGQTATGYKTPTGNLNGVEKWIRNRWGHDKSLAV